MRVPEDMLPQREGWEEAADTRRHPPTPASVPGLFGGGDSANNTPLHNGIARAGTPDTHPVKISTPQSEDDSNNESPATAAEEEEEEEAKGGQAENPVKRMVAYHEQAVEKEKSSGAGAGAGGAAAGAGAGAHQHAAGIPRLPHQQHQQQQQQGRGGSTPGSRNGTPPARAPPGHKRDAAGEEQGNALRSMSGVLIKEWWGCTSCIQWTHSSKGPGFNP
jgi:hypothetical protein